MDKDLIIKRMKAITARGSISLFFIALILFVSRLNRNDEKAVDIALTAFVGIGALIIQYFRHRQIVREILK